MRAYLVKSPTLFRLLYPSCIWKIPNANNEIFLTFDDGPNPEYTERILSVLAEKKVLATFFCIGNQVESHPQLFKKIIAAGHSLGNHSQTHKNGWRTTNTEYINDVKSCAEQINSKLFRPPYGKISSKQLKTLKDKYHVIMWDVIGGDFDFNLKAEDIKHNILKNTQSGSIIVLHDNPKFAAKMLAVLPQIIDELILKGFRFSAINDASLPLQV